MNANQIEKELIELISKFAKDKNKKNIAITLDSRFSDLGFDSYTAVDIMSEVESHFKTAIPDDKALKMVKVGDFLTFINK